MSGMSGWMPRGAVPGAYPGKEWLIGHLRYRVYAKHYHLAETEKATVSVCGLEIEGVRKPQGEGTLSTLCQTLPICAACRDVARLRSGRV